MLSSCYKTLPCRASGALAATRCPGRAHVSSKASLAARAGLGSVRHVSAGACRLRAAATSRPARRSRRPLEVTALVAIDYSQPAIWLGLGLIGGGLSLYQLRRVQPMLSRDVDIVVSSVVIFSGGILIFQGWRLDPLLLFCQLLTAGTALTWALEALRLRKLVENDQRFDERSRQYPPLEPPPQQGQDGAYGRGIPLPPPREDFGRWYGPPEGEQALYGDEGLPVASGQQPPQQYYGSQDGGGNGASYGPTYEESGFYSRGGPEQEYGGPAASSSGQYQPDYEEPEAGSRGGPGWGVVDDVESYYNRPPPGTITEDVERFYESGGGEEGAAEAGRSSQQGSGPGTEPRGGDWQYYGRDGQPSPEFPWPPPAGPPGDGWQAGGSGSYPGTGQASGDGRQDSGAQPRERWQ